LKNIFEEDIQKHKTKQKLQRGRRKSFVETRPKIGAYGYSDAKETWHYPGYAPDGYFCDTPPFGLKETFKYHTQGNKQKNTLSPFKPSSYFLNTSAVQKP
jgi:hypothetical protein